MIAASPAEAQPDITPQERRKRPDLRAAFEAIVQRVEPFFTKDARLNGGSTEFWAARVIRDVCPDLSSQDVNVLVAAAARYYRERGA